MKIDGSNIAEQKMVKSRLFQNARVSTSFLDTYMEKRDIVEKGMDQKTSGYDKSDLTHNDAKEEFQEKMAGTLDAKSRKNQILRLLHKNAPIQLWLLTKLIWILPASRTVKASLMIRKNTKI